MMKYLALALLLPACAGTQHALETAQAKLDAAQAKRAEVCAEALDTLQTVQAVAPFACGLVAATPDAPEQAKAACSQQDKLDAAVRNLTLACELGK